MPAMSNVWWPKNLAHNVICFSVDVEWASEAVLADLVHIFDEYGVAATFFVTHAGVATPGHERGLHPNFRRNGDTYRGLPNDANLSDEQVNEHVVAVTHGFAPEAKGLRSHSLFYDSTLLPIYSRRGLEYDASYQVPLVLGLSPFWKQHDILEIPTYYADHFDIMTHASGFSAKRLAFNEPGIKVLDFHPNMVFLNVSEPTQYDAARAIYHDPDALLRRRHEGKGARTMLLDILEMVAQKNLATKTLGEINSLWRRGPDPWK